MPQDKTNPGFEKKLALAIVRISIALLAIHAVPLYAEDKEKEQDKKQDSTKTSHRPDVKPESKPASAPAPKPSKPTNQEGSGIPTSQGRPGTPQGHQAQPDHPGAPVLPAQTGQPVRPGGPTHSGHQEQQLHQPGVPGPPPTTVHVDRQFPERQVVHTRNGGEIHRAPSGEISEVRTQSGAIIRHDPRGVRRVEVVRPGGKIIVVNASGRTGYIQRPLVSHGRSYIQRTSVYNGVAHATIYRPWSYRGREYQIYQPHHYYHPSFYTWVYRPWAVPIAYNWGWHSAPWYDYYGGYFTPYRTYLSPSFWLADFAIAATLQSAYLAQNSATGVPPEIYRQTTVMSPAAKDAIVQEVTRQMDQARSDQADIVGTEVPAAAPAIFSANGPKAFLVSSYLIAYAGNQECPLTEGDVLQLTSTPSPDSPWSQVKVLASRQSSCPIGSTLYVKTVELQEMHNSMQATIDQGLAKLQSDQGKRGIPSLPPQAMGIVEAPYTNDIVPDSNIQSELSQAIGEASNSEQAIFRDTDPNPALHGSGATVSLGMTIVEVEKSLGNPVNTIDLGRKKIHLYNNLKVTFMDGRVSDVQ